MLKGIYKEFITVKINDNPLYEEAFFVLKSSSEPKKSKKDMLFEANRILCEKGVRAPRKRKKILFSALLFTITLFIGIFLGALAVFWGQGAL